MTKSAKPPASADLAAVKDLILWAREKRIRLGQVCVGSIQLVLTDLAIPEGRRPVTTGTETTTDDPYRRYGGNHLEDAMAKAGMAGVTGESDANTIYEDDAEA